MRPLLAVEDLYVTLDTVDGPVEAVRGVNFTVQPGETVAIVGESGCGKSVTVQSIMRLLPSRIEKGSILFQGKELVSFSEKEMRQLRGSEMAMVFQDPLTALNPTMTLGKQITEGLSRKKRMRRQRAREKAKELLTMVGISNPELRLNQYPHQLSGGMRQRAMIAMGLSCQPALLIADEPTTALDVTIQAQILDLMQELQRKTGTAIVLITHDLGIVAEVADRVYVMYAGEMVESGTGAEIFYDPGHPYTQGLLASLPRVENPKEQSLASIPGTPPHLRERIQGCPFAERCPHVEPKCREEKPPSVSKSPTQKVACWLAH